MAVERKLQPGGGGERALMYPLILFSELCP